MSIFKRDDALSALTEVEGSQVIGRVDSTGAQWVRSGAVQTSVTGTTNSANLIAAAGNYADNDIIAHSASNGVGVPWKFTALGRYASATGTIVGASVKTSVAAWVAGFRIHLFNAIPTASEFDDNEAFSIHANDRTKYLGYIDITPSASMGGFSLAQNDALTKKYTADSSGDVYAIIQLTDAESNESAGMTVEPTLHVIQD